MLYVVLMPVERDNVRRLTLIHAKSYADVRAILGLPQGWLSFIGYTDAEVQGLMSVQDSVITNVLIKD